MDAYSAGAAFASLVPLLITGLVIVAFAWPSEVLDGNLRGLAAKVQAAKTMVSPAA